MGQGLREGRQDVIILAIGGRGDAVLPLVPDCGDTDANRPVFIWQLYLCLLRGDRKVFEVHVLIIAAV